jgi:hypothetical protein
MEGGTNTHPMIFGGGLKTKHRRQRTTAERPLQSARTLPPQLLEG